MSRVPLFAFVEGVNVDGYVHGANCDRALSPLGVEYRLAPADELPGTGGGKTRLKSYYSHLADNASLVTNFKGKVTVVLFFMDKDIDDQLGLLIESPHVLYTWFYDVENHVFHEGDVAEAVGSGCSLAPNWCREEFGGRGSWQETVARLWVEWVRLCFAVKSFKISGAANYGRPSAVNPTPHLPADATLVEAYSVKLKSEAQQAGVADRQWNAAIATVDSEYSTGSWDKVFKGKWYGHILSSQVLANCPNKIDSKHLTASLVRHVAATMEFNSPWSLAMQKKIQELAVSNGLVATSSG
ncbi:hypothetical protein F8R89_15360 [Streptomyces sp. SS1-1]|uniref:hypothetical protein n=1 Tax=Streptomyces sp. SS1-1 TaxID=2651869 RepID=UPI001250B3B2|nr:hypothetical protein [Streptomyces sp. SS1-1]KAB2973281.1 hypothetical protein F8R89_15360 [Streptomyces sp. SS1-1]